MAELNTELNELAESFLKSDKVYSEVFKELNAGSRRKRQIAASVISAAAKINPERVFDNIDELTDALHKPEAQTRWEILDTFTSIASVKPELCEGVLSEADEALFDEDNGFERLASLRFLCRYGASSQERSAQVWPLLDEALQCYHGDVEFNDMLLAVIEFSEGNLDAKVKDGLKARMSFDAENSKGTLGKRAKRIVDNLK